MPFDISKLAPLAQPLLNPQADLAALKAAKAHGWTTLVLLILGGALVALQCFSQAFAGTKLGVILGVVCAIAALVSTFLSSMHHTAAGTTRTQQISALLQLGIQAAQQVEAVLQPTLIPVASATKTETTTVSQAPVQGPAN